MADDIADLRDELGSFGELPGLLAVRRQPRLPDREYDDRTAADWLARGRPLRDDLHFVVLEKEI